MTVNQSNKGFASNYLENSSQRVFPPIKSDIYKPSSDLLNVTPDQKVALRLLNLTNRKINSFSNLLSWNLDAQEKINHLLNSHRLAIKAELEGQRIQADFYWKQVQIEIKQLAKQDKVWSTLVNELANESGVLIMNDPVKIRQRLVDELLIDTHYHFYHSIDRQSGKFEVKEQAFIHIKYIEELINLSNFSGDDLLAKLDYPWQKQINLYREEKKWHQAFLVCQTRLELFPDSIKFKNELAEIKIKLDSINKSKQSKKNILPKKITDFIQISQNFIRSKESKKSFKQTKNIHQIPDILQSNPVFKPKLNLEHPQKEPFLPWILSYQDFNSKILALLAFSFLTTSGIFLFRELSTISNRNQAYLAILQANQEKDFQKLFKSSEKFLNNKSFKGKDVRENEVKRFYSQAFVQWLARKEEDLSNDDWNIINQYESLNNND